jgi:hypothetical protein
MADRSTCGAQCRRRASSPRCERDVDAWPGCPPRQPCRQRTGWVPPTPPAAPTPRPPPPAHRSRRPVMHPTRPPARRFPLNDHGARGTASSMTGWTTRLRKIRAKAASRSRRQLPRASGPAQAAHCPARLVVRVRSWAPSPQRGLVAPIGAPRRVGTLPSPATSVTDCQRISAGTPRRQGGPPYGGGGRSFGRGVARVNSPVARSRCAGRWSKQTADLPPGGWPSGA